MLGKSPTALAMSGSPAMAGDGFATKEPHDNDAAKLSQIPREGQHALSCTHCRQRKVKCDKVHPCCHCLRSNLTCVFPERAKNAKKKRSGQKTTNDELLRRLKRMEELIGKMEGDGKDISPSRSHDSSGVDQANGDIPRSTESGGSPSIPDDGQDRPKDGLSRYIGNSFLRSLTMEVEGLRQSMDEDTDIEEMSSPSVKSPPDTHTPISTAPFASTLSAPKDLRLLHPPPSHIALLFTIFKQNVDPMYKVLHIPTFGKMVSEASMNVDHIPTGTHVEALLFAMYYAAVTSLTREECLQHFGDAKDSLLAKYRVCTERALSNANFLSECDLGSLQALTVLLITLRANDSSQYTWTMLAVAVRLGHSLGLHREGSQSGLSPFMEEQRRRLWWSIIVLDIRCAEDVATDPMILESSFNTRRPLNINDSDMDPESTLPIVERKGFTEMTKCRLSHFITFMCWRIGYSPPVKEGHEPYTLSVETKLQIMKDVEKHIEENVLAHCDPSNPVAWVTSVVAQLILRRLRMAIYHPLQYGHQPTDRPKISREVLLRTAIESLEYAHLLDSEPVAAKWRWFFLTYVQWHALAACLAELCVKTHGPLVDRAWRIIDTIFDDWADRVADSPNGMLWRPIKKLKNKATAVRNAAQAARNTTSPMQLQMPLPYFGTPAVTSLQAPPIEVTSIDLSMPPALNQPMVLDPPSFAHSGLPSEGFAALNVGDSTGSINWAEWDEFMHDYQTDIQSAHETSKLPPPEMKLQQGWW